MEDDKKYIAIRMLTKVFTEGINQYWWLDMEKYMRLAAKYDFDATKLQKAIECSEDDEGKTISPKTINRVLGYIYGEKEGKGDKSVTIDTIKALGKALCHGDEYGLLIKIEPSNVLHILKEIEKYWDSNSEMKFNEEDIEDEAFLQAAKLFF